MFRTLMWVYLPNRRACHSSKYCGSLENSPAIVQQTRNQVSRIASIRSINVATSRLVMKVGKAVCLADLRINVKVVFCFALSSWLLRWLDTCVTICSIAELSQQGVQIFVAVVVELLSLFDTSAFCWLVGVSATFVGLYWLVTLGTYSPCFT